jgi:hypothetical protein
MQRKHCQAATTTPGLGGAEAEQMNGYDRITVS